MKVIVATPYLHGSIIGRLFAGHDAQVLPENYEKTECDILVFSGGEDVHPSYYGEQGPNRGWFNRERDEQEISILQNIGKKIFPKKVLGICRGHQLLNVYFGGNLVYDIATTYGEGHEYIHPLVWREETPFNSFLQVTNSMHHQGLSRIGENYNYRILAIEPKTRIVEAILWSDRYLGVQFHPESLSNDLATKFREVMEKWVAGEPLVKSSGSVKRESKLDWTPRLYTRGEEGTVTTADMTNITVDWADLESRSISNITDIPTPDIDEEEPF
jgi:putative glutamine amidotransferase